MGYESKNWVTKDQDKHGPPALPLGVYQCQFVKAEAKDSKSSGNPMIEVMIEPISNFDGEPVKGNFRDFLTFTDGSIFKVVQALEACDLEVEELSTDLELREQLAEAFVGLKFWATLGPTPAANGSGREFTGVLVYLTEKEATEAAEKLAAGDAGSQKQNGAAKSSVVRRRST